MKYTPGETKQGLWTAKQAAAFLSVQTRTMKVWRYLKRYPLPFVKKRFWVYYSPAEVRAFARTYAARRKEWTKEIQAAWLTEEETAALLGVSRGTLAKWRRQRHRSPAYVEVDARVHYARARVLAFGKKYAASRKLRLQRDSTSGR